MAPEAAEVPVVTDKILVERLSQYFLGSYTLLLLVPADPEIVLEMVQEIMVLILLLPVQV